MGLLDNNHFVSRGSIGAKIKKIRELRGLTQKELGLRCGFSEATAAVRIRQYESNQKTPREKALHILAEALEIDTAALFDADFSPAYNAAHALFDLEDFHGLQPVFIKGAYYLQFDPNNKLDKYFEFQRFMELWNKRRTSCLPEERDDEKKLSEKQKTYDLWRYEYPLNEAKKNSRELGMMRKKARLERELEKVNDELNALKDD